MTWIKSDIFYILKENHIGGFSAGTIFPQRLPCPAPLISRPSGCQVGEGGGREINFPGFPNLHSAAKKSICLIYREVRGGEEIAAALNYGKRGFGPAAKTFLTPCWPEWRRNRAWFRRWLRLQCWWWCPRWSLGRVSGWEEEGMTWQDDAGVWISHTLPVTQWETKWIFFVVDSMI